MMRITRSHIANSSTYGLSSAVLTNNLQLAMRFALELEAGMVHLNGPTIHDEGTVPFGGVKDSGMGREGGRWSTDEMTEVKWVTIQTGRRQYAIQPELQRHVRTIDRALFCRPRRSIPSTGSRLSFQRALSSS